MSTSIHQAVVNLLMIHARVYDGRIRHIPAGIRRCKRDGVDVRSIVREVVAKKSSSMDADGINASTGRRVWRRSTLESLRIACRAIHVKFGYTGVDLLHRVWSCYAICGGHIPSWAGCPTTRICHMDPEQMEVAREVNRVLGASHYSPDGLNV